LASFLLYILLVVCYIKNTMQSRFKKLLLLGFFLNFLVIGGIYFFTRSSKEVKCVDVKDTSTLFSHLHYQEVKNGIKFWELKAQEAQRIQGDTEKLRLVKVKAIFYLQQGLPVYLEAEKGIFNTKTKDFILKGNVHIWQPGGYTFSTTMVVYTPKKDLLYTTTPVTITRKDLHLQAKRMQFFVKENRIVFYKEVKSCFYVED